MDFSPTPIDGSRSHDDALDGFDAGPCQLCGSGPSRVGSYMWVMSFLVFTRHAEYDARLCRACSTRQGLKEMGKSAALGWWGIPWGLLTLKALWVNGRSLARWSTLPAVAAIVVTLAALVTPPAAVGALVWWSMPAAERAARRTGDWVDEDVVQEVTEGHRLIAEGDAAGALEHYRKAQAKAPRSSVANYSVAQAYVALGEIEAALPYAATAEERAPEDAAAIAFHGWILAALGRNGAAHQRVEKLRQVEPPDVESAVQMADLFDLAGEPEELLRVLATPAVAEDAELQDRRLVTLVGLNRVDEAAAVEAALPASLEETSARRFVLDLQALSTDPAASLDGILATWSEESYTDWAMERIVAAAERSGQGEAVRREVEDFLLADSTPPEVWGSARPWFDDDAWPRVLDRRLARRLEAVPGYARLTLYDPMAERRDLVALADRLRRLDHPLAEAAEGYYFAYGPGADSEAAAVAALEAHLTAGADDHFACRLQLAAWLARSRPARSEELLNELVRRRPEDPALVAERQVLEAEGKLVEQPQVALEQLRSLAPGAAEPYSTVAVVDLITAEAAFHAGDGDELQRRLERLVDGDAVGGHSAALLLRWSQQLAAGEPPTYRADVDAFLARRGEAVHSETATSTQAILLAEGVARRTLITAERQSTVRLVAALRDAAQSGGGDLSAIADVAATPPAHEFAPALARVIVERRGALETQGVAEATSGRLD